MNEIGESRHDVIMNDCWDDRMKQPATTMTMMIVKSRVPHDRLVDKGAKSQKQEY